MGPAAWRRGNADEHLSLLRRSRRSDAALPEEARAPLTGPTPTRYSASSRMPPRGAYESSPRRRHGDFGGRPTGSAPSSPRPSPSPAGPPTGGDRQGHRQVSRPVPPAVGR